MDFFRYKQMHRDGPWGIHRLVYSGRIAFCQPGRMKWSGCFFILLVLAAPVMGTIQAQQKAGASEMQLPDASSEVQVPDSRLPKMPGLDDSAQIMPNAIPVDPTAPVTLAAGQYTLENARPFFQERLIFEVQPGSGKPDALLKSMDQKSGQTSQPTDAIASIVGLKKKGGEYLYGRLIIHTRGQTYRCKIWQRGRYLFLRIYDPYTYHTFKMEPHA